MKTLKELLEERNAIHKLQCEINDKAKAEKRDLSAEETEHWNKANVDFERLTDEINKAKERERRDIEFEARRKMMASAAGPSVPPKVGDGSGKDANQYVDIQKESRHYDAIMSYRNQTKGMVARVDYRDAFRKYLIGGQSSSVPDYCLSAREREVIEECRALQADADALGGFLVVPEEFVARLIQAMDNMVFVDRMATVFDVPNAASLGAPSLDNDPGNPTWTAEILTGSEDSSMNFGKRELHPHPLARRIKVSKKLLRVARMNVDTIVRDRLAYKFATVRENAFLNGNGVNQPLGVFVASNDGVSTARDVSTGNTLTAITGDNLVNVKYNQKAQYRNTSRWLFHRDAIRNIRKLKDGEGNYLWRPGIATDAPDTILDIPFDESEYAPNTFTTGQYVGILADWKHYWIANALNMNIQVLTELYAETNQNGYIGRMESDGMPVLAEAFCRVKLA